MCGIVGYVGPDQALPIVMEGLRRLEYRGYDSAGVAVLDGDIGVVKRAGKLVRARGGARREAAPCRGRTGMGHTRWATHGAPTDANAHPHLDCAGRHRRHPQRHHRELPVAARRAVEGRPPLRLRDRHRGRRPPARGRLRRATWRRRSAPSSSAWTGAYALVVAVTPTSPTDRRREGVLADHRRAGRRGEPARVRTSRRSCSGPEPIVPLDEGQVVEVRAGRRPRSPTSTAPRSRSSRSRSTGTWRWRRSAATRTSC